MLYGSFFFPSFNSPLHHCTIASQHNRNRIITLNLKISMASLAAGTGAALGGLWGMNLHVRQTPTTNNQQPKHDPLPFAKTDSGQTRESFDRKTESFSVLLCSSVFSSAWFRGAIMLGGGTAAMDAAAAGVVDPFAPTLLRDNSGCNWRGQRWGAAAMLP